jgi:hypothetical protein
MIPHSSLLTRAAPHASRMGVRLSRGLHPRVVAAWARDNGQVAWYPPQS